MCWERWNWVPWFPRAKMTLQSCWLSSESCRQFLSLAQVRLLLIHFMTVMNNRDNSRAFFTGTHHKTMRLLYCVSSLWLWILFHPLTVEGQSRTDASSEQSFCLKVDDPNEWTATTSIEATLSAASREIIFHAIYAALHLFPLLHCKPINPTCGIASRRCLSWLCYGLSVSRTLLDVDFAQPLDMLRT